MADPTPYTIQFRYNGSVRVVINPAWKVGSSGQQLIVGYEIRKGDAPSAAVKAYRSDRIDGGVTTVAQ